MSIGKFYGMGLAWKSTIIEDDRLKLCYMC